MIDTRVQNLIFLEGENFVGLFFLRIKGMRMIIEETKATTPPNFDGMDRRTT
jgi:hypothetical protein